MMRDHRVAGVLALVSALSLQSSVSGGGDGAIRWAGLTRTQLHAGGDVGWRAAVEVVGGRDEWARAGGGGAWDRRAGSFVSGRGHAERVAVRVTEAACSGSRGGDGSGAEGLEERSAGRMGSGQRAAHGGDRDEVFKAPEHLAGLRNAVRAYGFAVTDVVRAKNRLKSVFLSRGISTDAAVYDPTKRTDWLKKLSPPHRELAEWLGRQLDHLEPLREEAERLLLAEAKKHPIIKTLSTAPGMGPIRTAQVVAIVATPERFRTRRQLWSYSGLGIVTRSSADWAQDRTGKWVHAQRAQTRGLSRKRHPRLKAVFKGAATTVIAQLAADPLHADYERMLKSGIKPTLAKLTLARKIAATVLSMWKRQEVYDPKRHRPTSEQT
jgi:Transposase IS116/IS110/IS902 family